MDLRVVGCHGGESAKHRTSAFVLDGKLAIDAGSLTSGLSLRDQYRLEACLVSHSHLDHIRDLATIADNRVQKGCEPLVVAGTKPTLDVLAKHFFNGVVWPDFSRIPSAKRPGIRYLALKAGTRTNVAGYMVRPIPVTHTIDCSAFVIESKHGAVAYSGDTGPTDQLWRTLNKTPDLRALLMEVSFPNAEQKLATVSGHHTPQTLSVDLGKFDKHKELPVLLYHIKPAFQRQVERECAKLRGFNLHVLNIGDEFLL